ncbi:O-glucosyltransferase rumi homolog [Anopheles marshallii]|uniref:O-glucosyltransferase rumi homolog n=1 Tax=Anopheles marshallii TaxID=1521116 RepID=UPI00237A2B75|nr:O-glucosyltransferase rumi homolog [Anopheles marshallii]
MELFKCFLLCLVICVGKIHSSDEGMCTAKEQCTVQETDTVSNDFYSADFNKYFSAIESSVAGYVPCNNTNCNCHTDVLKADLKPFKLHGITKDSINRAKQYGTHYQVVGHKLYRQRECMFPARCSGVEHFVKPLLSLLPDMDLIVNCRDWPQIHRHWNKERIPVLSFSKTNEYLDIMYPAWAFWEGGPAIALYPTGLGRWDLHRKSITKASTDWDSKESKAFFRGSRTSDERDALVLLSRAQPSLVDAQYTKNQAWKSPQDTLNAEPAREVTLEEHCRYRFLFNFRGVAASFRFKHLFLCRSLVFHVGDEWLEFFYPSLKPWVHYVPVPVRSSPEELEALIRFFQQHDQLARDIAERGYDHVWNNLRMGDVECYWKKLLKRYGKLVRYTVERDSSLIEV